MSGEVTAKALVGLEGTNDPAVSLTMTERLVAAVRTLEDELGRARDEINRLKGEQGRPSGRQKKRQQRLVVRPPVC